MLVFLLTNLALGVGLAMDAFSVSMANGLNEPNMKKSKMLKIAGVYGIFQGVMPMTGWFCVHTIVNLFTKFEPAIPWIALILLLWIGGGMVKEGLSGEEKGSEVKTLTGGQLFLQGLATSIDALSVGFTIAEYNVTMAFAAACLIAFVTFIICLCGVKIGKVFGMKLADKATVFGGIILILIGLEIWISGVFF